MRGVANKINNLSALFLTLFATFATFSRFIASVKRRGENLRASNGSAVSRTYTKIARLALSPSQKQCGVCPASTYPGHPPRRSELTPPPPTQDMMI